MEAIVVSSKCPRDKASAFLTQNENLNIMFLAQISTVASQSGAHLCERAWDHQERDTATCVYMLCLGYLREVQRRRAACVTIFQMLQYIRNEKISKDFNIEEECWLCRSSCLGGWEAENILAVNMVWMSLFQGKLNCWIFQTPYEQ